MTGVALHIHGQFEISIRFKPNQSLEICRQSTINYVFALSQDTNSG